MRFPLGLIVPVQDPTPFSPFVPARWPEALSEVAEVTYETVELAITDPTRLSPDEVATALGRAGVRLCAITTGQAAALEGLSLSTPDDSLRERAVERILAHMRLARRFGAVVIVGSLRGREGSLDLLVDSLKACAAHEPETRLVLEAINRYESTLACTVADALAVIDRVGMDNVGVHFDTFHANIEERTLAGAIRSAADRLQHVHLADSNRWVPGHGHLSFDEVWQALAEIGYGGSLVLEALPLASVHDLLGAAEVIRRQWS